MPGIIAIIDPNIGYSATNQNLLKIMASTISHENWQKVDTYIKPPIYIGRVHLGITNAEPQPIFNEDESICIFMDGEVFGYDEEKKKLELSGHDFRVGNDPEFCLHLFEEYGEKFVEKLDGSFVLVIYDMTNDKIIIANDRHGLRPFYYTKNENKCVFSAEVKGILKDEAFKKEVDHEAVADFFAFGRILGDKTLLKGIKLMPPSSIMTWSRNKISIEKYWDFDFQEKYDPNLNEEYYVDKLAILFRKSTERRTKGKHRIGVFLSGGMDSRLIVSAIDREFYPICTFTYGVKGGDEANIAKQVSENLGTKHKFLEIRRDYLVEFAEKGVYLTDGMLNCAHLWWISLLPTVRQYVDVMFHGTALDILLSSQWYGLKQRELLKAKKREFASVLYKEFNSLISEEIMPLFFSNTYYKKIKTYPFKSFKKCLDKVTATDAVNKSDSFFLRSVGRYYISSMVLRNYCEDRAPGLDKDFFEFVLKIPRNLRSQFQKLYFELLARLSPDLARISYQRTGVAPTAPILAHKIGFLLKGGYKFLGWKLREKSRGTISLPEKFGYPDLGEWIRKDSLLRTYFENILLDKKTLNREYFNPSFIAKMVDEHMTGKKDWAMQLCALLTFELWHRLFIDPS
jgi:asparagine synthase (glutamine-hydrolysing)